MFTSPALWWIVWIVAALAMRKKKLKQKLLWGLLIYTLVLTNLPLYSWVVKNWAYPLTPIISLKPHHVAIVLGGATKYDAIDTNRIFLNENAGDRVLHSVQLYKQGYAKKILFTSGSAALTGVKKPEAHFARKLYYMLGVPTEDLILEQKSRNTYENALYTKAILDTLTGNKNFILVTNALHMRRGQACFKKLGIECTPFVVDNEGYFDALEWYEWIMPKMYVLSGWERLSHEFFGFLAYKFKGYC